MAHVDMLAAIQPLITCSISKTVNLAKNTTPEEIADIYLQAWKLGVKCIALYRDGSKMSQPLVTKTSEAPTVSIAPPSEEATRRRHLPADLEGHRHRFTMGGCKGYIMMNEYPDGSLGEVFLRLGKTGTTMAGFIDGFTQLLSISLQYGVPLDKMIRSFVHTKFEPSGFTDNPQIRFADSLFDYLFKLLDIRYFEGRNSGLADKLAAMASESEDAGSLPPVSMPAPEPVNVSAPICPNCGSMTRRVGTCHLCATCGTSTGCS
jgi:ribonucleoside-diphosphate reductase alpha chain